MLVVTLHAQTSVAVFPELFTDRPFYRIITYVFSLSIGEVAVPCFFFISGYLFFKKNKNNAPINYKEKLRSRLHTLLVPYIIWNAITLFLLFVAQNITILSPYFSSDSKLICHFTLIDFLRAFWDCGAWNGGNSTPILGPYWYIRNLMLCSILAPLIAIVIKRLKVVYLLPLFILWLQAQHVAFTLVSLLFFSLGSSISLNNKTLISTLSPYRTISFVLFLCFLTLDIGFKVWPVEKYIQLSLHKIGLITYLVFFFNMAFLIVQKYSLSIPHRLQNLSFFIFTTHANVILAASRVLAKSLYPASQGVMLAAYFGSIVLTIAFCSALYLLLNKCMPSFLHFSMGREYISKQGPSLT